MTIHEFLGAFHQSFRTLLVLQGDQAFWFRWRRAELLESFVEPINPDMCSGQFRCPWIDADTKGGEFAVELILNTSLDELDRVNADKHSSPLVHRIQANSLMRKLATDFPSASVHRIPNYLEPACASILHHVIPDIWEVWLNSLQLESVILTHVVTSTQLLSEWSGKKSGLNLFVQELGAEQRHLLLDGATPIYMRIVKCDSTYCDEQVDTLVNPQIAQTLEYVAEHILPKDIAPSVLQLSLDTHSPSREFAAARLLSYLYLGLHSELIVNKAQFVNPSEQAAGKKLTSVVSAFFVSMLPASFYQPIVIVWRRLAINVQRHCWRISNGIHAKNKILAPSLLKTRLQNRVFRLQKATMVCAVAATLMAALATAHAFASARERYRLNIQKSELHKSLDSVSQSVLALHMAPLYVVRSLQRIDLHRAIVPMAPEHVLNTIATALTLFPTITLNGLSWTVIADEQTVDEVFTTVAGVSSRDKVWSEDSPLAQLQLELKGTVDSDAGLRAKQDTIDSFVSHLESVSGIKQVTVLDSPLETVLSNSAASDGVSSYRVSVLLSAI